MAYQSSNARKPLFLSQGNHQPPLLAGNVDYMPGSEAAFLEPFATEADDGKNGVLRSLPRKAFPANGHLPYFGCIF